MKNYYYHVVFENGKEETFYCIGFVEAIILAMAYAQHMGWDMRLKHITDEKGTTAKDIQFPEFKIGK